MTRTVYVDGKALGMSYPVIAQNEVLNLLNVESYQELGDALQNNANILSPVMLGKMAFIGCRYYALKNKQPFDFTEEEFLLNITSPLAALEQLLDDFGMMIPEGVLPKKAVEVGRRKK